MESEKGNDGKMSRTTIDSSILFNSGNTLDVKNSRNGGNSKEVIVEGENRIEDKVQGETILLSENNNFSCSNSEIVYDEYEEDEDYVRWQLPKRKTLPTISTLLYEWSKIQVSVVHTFHIKILSNKG
ncbi:PREDICTED: uncharacterized protein LOC105147976 isoform X2 [Acromyrmex echinatior]|uniref:uncharacterized protein LOC105147976 isoform X2 n=1 Tax=Acromyrmex echinatior TaxID=103372 RepID=UPI0005810558|nr:PREDICTED: uncharacterized protein LOC105147976 isoform X2 [Acromyrmex echinatior]